ncbi:hypothetical protein PSYMO_34866, partial [Pseudomonas amygdali pv. mori str. 301020]
RAFSLIIDAYCGDQRRKYFPLITTEVFRNGQSDTADLKSGTAYFLMTWRNRTKFCGAYCMRAAFAGD